MDTGVIVAYYSADDKYHTQAQRLFELCTSQAITTVACVTEAMYLLAADWRVQNEFLLQVSSGIFNCEHLTTQDFTRITELNAQYADLPGAFADLGLVAILKDWIFQRSPLWIEILIYIEHTASNMSDCVFLPS
jgi:hypothetical protein